MLEDILKSCQSRACGGTTCRSGARGRKEDRGGGGVRKEEGTRGREKSTCPLQPEPDQKGEQSHIPTLEGKEESNETEADHRLEPTGHFSQQGNAHCVIVPFCKTFSSDRFFFSPNLGFRS